MTIILRTLAVISAVLGAVLFAMPIIMLTRGGSGTSGAVASTILVLLAIPAMRCAKWLWSKRRFWKEIRSLSEVSSFGCLVLFWPIVVFLEQRTDGLAKVLVQFTPLLIALSVYVSIRRYGRTEKTTSRAS